MQFEPHNFNRKLNHWQYCSKCGLVALKNKLTEWCISKGCDYKDHPSYPSKLKDIR
jgi:hypothetical protein